MEKVASVVILHGWTYSLDRWQEFLSQLEKSGIVAELLQIPGLTDPLDKVWSLDDYVDWLKRELQSKQGINLIGHSFGGKIAVRFTARHPLLVKKLVLIDSAGIRDKSLLARMKRTVFFWLAKLGKLVSTHDFFRKLLYTIAREKDYYEAPARLRKTMSRVIKEEIVNDLPKLSIPVCIIWGKEDRITPVSQAYLFAKLIPNSELHVIGNARHSPQFTQPSKVARLVKRFVR